MKFVNLDESEIIEQPLEKVIARPDYSPVEFVYDDLCSLDSVSVDGIHPSGDDPDLILSPSINKINNCFKSEYFKISNLFSEIQTYEQKQEALKNLGLLDAINNARPTTAITITLHANRYAQLSDDVDIVAALQAKNTALEGTGGSISLVSA